MTPTLSVALPYIVTSVSLFTFAPFTGEVIETDGAIISGVGVGVGVAVGVAVGVLVGMFVGVSVGVGEAARGPIPI